MFHILVVDDDKNTRQLIKAVLETENYIVIGATDGEDALKVLDRSHIDLVILDVMMPKMDGITVLKTIRRHGNSVPVLLLTAKAEIDDRVEGFRQWRRRLSAETIFHERASGEDPGNDKETDGHDR